MCSVLFLVIIFCTLLVFYPTNSHGRNRDQDRYRRTHPTSDAPTTTPAIKGVLYDTIANAHTGDADIPGNLATPTTNKVDVSTLKLDNGRPSALTADGGPKSTPPTKDLLNNGGREVIFAKRISCKCSCCPRSSNSATNLTAEELEEKLENITKALTVKTDTLSSNVRKSISIPDDRPSSQFLGQFAILFITFVCIAVSLPDILKVLYRANRRFKIVERCWPLRKCKELFQFLWKKWQNIDKPKLWRQIVDKLKKLDRCGVANKCSKLKNVFSEKLSLFWDKCKSLNKCNIVEKCRSLCRSRD